MQPEKVQVESFVVAGIQTRTTNAQEMNPLTAKIPALWGRFMSEGHYNRIPQVVADSPVYGVYADFESDANGAYSLIAGRAVSAASSETASATIAAGTYLKFAAPGPCPQVVISTWMAIWQYFQANPQIQRAYVSDFERYESPEGIEIYIGVQG
ncbi:GyrI-like domain-containing protein [Parvibium lacunae]|uniref:AraC family transcriptional regulator n=1 Tax=Parvibium lacunae TaxID=1888893 RepID=A0A368L7T2_9BURK|nr:GyrI-like domain-containing protein [Parvibium lacunae]RCS59299.1 AraC family transcriptional regulator [Parvibium lacunae]